MIENVLVFLICEHTYNEQIIKIVREHKKKLRTERTINII